ncbi:MAG: transcription termination factor NusA [Acutalibacteraceae bacterium]|nr:transcription termination factor NusA [Acutalibacteraceae bacterium]
MKNNEFFAALEMMEKEKGIPAEFIAEKIENAIIITVRKDYGGEDIIHCNIDCDKQIFEVYIEKNVVDEIENEFTDITVSDAQAYLKDAKVGDTVKIQLDTMQFGRIAAQTAKHVIRQGIRDAERDRTRVEFQNKNQELVSAKVLRIDPVSGNATIEIAKSEATLPKSEMLEKETFKEGDIIKVFIVDVKETDKGPKAILSRTHSGLVRRMFEQEVPEIYDGIIEIKSITREAGSRTKIAVYSKDENVDAIGSCIGPKGTRVNKILEELGEEKIDIVKYSDDPVEFIKEALSPAKVLSVEVDSEGAKSCKATVPDSQLSLAIGNKGQNVRLAARLTGWKIDIRPESGFYGE